MSFYDDDAYYPGCMCDACRARHPPEVFSMAKFIEEDRRPIPQLEQYSIVRKRRNGLFDSETYGLSIVKGAGMLMVKCILAPTQEILHKRTREYIRDFNNNRIWIMDLDVRQLDFVSMAPAAWLGPITSAEIAGGRVRKLLNLE